MSNLQFTPRFNRAIAVAAQAHQQQRRKASNLPYICHPFAVMTIALQATNDENTLIACLFHDILEDVPEQYSLESMQHDFGPDVVKIVQNVTKDDTLPGWRAKSEAYLARVAAAPDEAVVVFMADKIHNLMSMLDDFQTRRSAMWDIFHTGQEGQLWFYAEVDRIAQQRSPHSPLAQKLHQLIEQLPPLPSRN